MLKKKKFLSDNSLSGYNINRQQKWMDITANWIFLLHRLLFPLRRNLLFRNEYNWLCVSLFPFLEQWCLVLAFCSSQRHMPMALRYIPISGHKCVFWQCLLPSPLASSENTIGAVVHCTQMDCLCKTPDNINCNCAIGFYL